MVKAPCLVFKAPCLVFKAPCLVDLVVKAPCSGV